MGRVHSQPLFSLKSSNQNPFFEISRVLGVSERTAKRYIKEGLEDGFIKKEPTQHKCCKHKTPIFIRNISYLTGKQQDHLNDPKQESFDAPKVNKPKGVSL